MKTTTKTYFTLFCAMLWILMLACHFTPKQQPVDIDTITWFPMHSEIPRDEFRLIDSQLYVPVITVGTTN